MNPSGRELRHDQIEAIQGYWLAGDNPRVIAAKVGVSSNSVRKYTDGLPRMMAGDPLTTCERSVLLQSWRVV